MRKYRHELKYIINKNQAAILKARLSMVMMIDTNSIYKDHTYLIRSLYFDTPNSQAYYEKLDGTLYRSKYRFRLYNQDDTFIRLERKLKHNQLTSKDGMKIERKIVEKIILGEVSDINPPKGSLLDEFIRDMNMYALRPSVIVDYKRLAFTYPVSDVRITFDEHIRSGRYQYDLFDKDIPTYEVMDENQTVLEVKFNEFLPEHIALILTTVPMFRQAVSKFAVCRSIK